MFFTLIDYRGREPFRIDIHQKTRCVREIEDTKWGCLPVRQRKLVLAYEMIMAPRRLPGLICLLPLM